MNYVTSIKKTDLLYEVEFKAVYSLGNINSRPDGFEVRYSLDGGKQLTETFTNNGDKNHQ